MSEKNAASDKHVLQDKIKVLIEEYEKEYPVIVRSVNYTRAGTNTSGGHYVAYCRIVAEVKD